MVCKTCEGTGGITSTINGALFGAGYWPMDYGEPCPDCVEKGLCPRCETKMNELDSGTYRCLKCGWDEATGDIVKKAGF